MINWGVSKNILIKEDKMKLQFRFLKLEEIVDGWSTLKKGFEKVLEHAKYDDDIETVLRRLTSGELLIAVVIRDHVYSGFVTMRLTHESRFKEENVTGLIVVHYYLTPQLQYVKAWKTVNLWLEHKAKEANCKFIKTYTSRNIEKRMKQEGYEKTYSEYVKEI